MTYSKEEIKERYNKLPLRLRDEIWNEENGQLIQQIAAENNLRVDQMGVLADETGLVMLGLTKPGDFIANLETRMKSDRDKARKVAQQVNERIFSKVRDALKQIHGITEPGKPVKPPEPPKKGEENFRISDTIKPQPGILSENIKKVSFSDEETTPPPRPSFEARVKNIQKVAQALENQPEAFKEPGGPKNIFEERMKEEEFHAPSVTVEKTPFVPEVKPPEKPPQEPPKPTYAKGADPYREEV